MIKENQPINGIGYKTLVLIIISFSLLMPFVELTMTKFGFSFDAANMVNSVIILTIVFALILIKKSISKTLIIVFFYITAKSCQGIVNGIPFPHVLISSAGILLIFSIYNFFYRRCLSDLIWFLKKNNILLLSLLILTSEVNNIVSELPLPLLFQNLSLVILLSSVYLIYIEKKIRGINTYIIAIIIGYVALLYIRADNTNSILQVKFFVFCTMIFTCYFLLLVFSRYFDRLIKFNKINYQFISIVFIVFLIIFLYSIVLQDYSVLFNRGHSGYVRLIVNNSMLDEIHRWSSTTLFGYGVGSSWDDFYLSKYTDNLLKAPAHSGLYVFYYEHGLAGVLLFVYTFFTTIKHTPIINNTGIVMYKNYRISTYGALFFMKFIIVFWICLNLVIIASMPGPNVFWNSGLVIFLLLWMITTRIALQSKFKLKA